MNDNKHRRIESEAERNLEKELFRTFYINNNLRIKEEIREKSLLDFLNVESILSKPIKIINRRSKKLKDNTSKTMFASPVKKPDLQQNKNIILVPIKLKSKDVSKNKEINEVPKNKVKTVYNPLPNNNKLLNSSQKLPLKDHLIFSSYMLSRNHNIVSQIFSKKKPKFSNSSLKRIRINTSSLVSTTMENSKQDTNKLLNNRSNKGEFLKTVNNLYGHNFISTVKRDLIMKAGGKLYDSTRLKLFAMNNKTE